MLETAGFPDAGVDAESCVDHHWEPDFQHPMSVFASEDMVLLRWPRPRDCTWSKVSGKQGLGRGRAPEAWFAATLGLSKGVKRTILASAVDSGSFLSQSSGSRMPLPHQNPSSVR